MGRAIQMARACESARQETQTLRGQTLQSARQTETAFGVTQSTTGGSSQYAKSSYKSKACSRCDGTNDSSDKCRYKSFICHYCKKTGHIIQDAGRKNETSQTTDIRSINRRRGRPHIRLTKTRLVLYSHYHISVVLM